MDEDLRPTLAAIRADHENDATLQTGRPQLNTLEYGVLTIAQKLLAEAEAPEIKSRMLRAS